MSERRDQPSTAAGKDLKMIGDAADAGDRLAPRHDEVDPELAALARPRRHPLLSVVVIAFSAYLMAFTFGDLLYFFQPRQPRDLGSAPQAVESGALATSNRYVRVEGAPDRKHAILLEGRFGGYNSFFRLLESQSKLFVQLPREKRASEREVPGVHTGRLTPFDDLPYARSIRDYLRRTMNIPHELSFSAVAEGKRTGRNVLTDQTGRRLELSRAQLFWINVAFPNEWIVQLSKKAYASRQEAQQQIDRLDLPYAVDEESSPTFWRFVVLAEGEQLQRLMELFRDPSLNAGVVRRQVTYVARWSEIEVQPEALVLRTSPADTPVHYRLPDTPATKQLLAQQHSPARVPRRALLYISTSSPFEVPAGARTIIVGEAPAGHWYYAVLHVLLLGFIVFNGLSLLNRWRQRR